MVVDHHAGRTVAWRHPLFGFVAVEATTGDPLLSLRIPGDRNRGGASLAVGLSVVALYGLFLLLTYDFQVVLGCSPAKAGLAFLPMSAAVIISSTTISRALLPWVAPRALMVPGLLLGAGGMAILTHFEPGGAFTAYALPAEILLGLGMGAVFVPAFSTATTGVDQREAGVASAVANTAEQMGASLGTVAAQHRRCNRHRHLRGGPRRRIGPAVGRDHPGGTGARVRNCRRVGSSHPGRCRFDRRAPGHSSKTNALGVPAHQGRRTTRNP